MPSLNQLLARVADMFSIGVGAMPLANRNEFIDGRFDSWNANSATATGTYGPCVMWMNSAGTGGTATVSQVNMFGADTGSFGVIESSPVYGILHQQTVASTGTVAARSAPFLIQRVEDVRKFAGRSATFSIKLWTNASPFTIPGIIASQDFGAGGSPSPAVVLDKTVNWNITTTPKKFSVRIDFPSIAGKTLGTNGVNQLTIGLWLPPGTVFTLIAVEAQLEKCNPNASNDINGAGGNPSTFEWRGSSVEILRVQRHYYSSYWDLQFPGTAGVNASFASSSIGTNTYSNICHATYPAAMRTNPSVAMYSPNSGASGKYYSNNTTTDLAATVLAGTSRTCSVGAAGNAPSVGQGMQICIVADARL